MNYTVTYARVVIMTTTVEAKNEGEAYTKAAALDIRGNLGPKTVTPKPGSEVVSIVDYDAIWNAKPAGELDTEKEE